MKDELASKPKTVQTVALSQNSKRESSMSHSKTVQTRRKKEKVKKTNARIAKAAERAKRVAAKK